MSYHCEQGSEYVSDYNPDYDIGTCVEGIKMFTSSH